MVTNAENDVPAVLARTDHWHYWPDEYALIGCGYAERGEPCPVPYPVYATTPIPPAETYTREDMARAFDEGAYARGKYE